MDPQTHFCRTNSSVTNFLTSPKTSCRSLRAVRLTRGSSNETHPPALSVYVHVPRNILPWLHPEPAEKFPDSTWKRGCQWWWGNTKGEWSTERRGGSPSLAVLPFMNMKLRMMMRSPSFAVWLSLQQTETCVTHMSRGHTLMGSAPPPQITQQ